MSELAAEPGTAVNAEVRAGGCLCGAVRFTVAGEPDYPHTCSCRHCQTRGGGPEQWWVSFPLEGVTWTGTEELTWYDTWPGKTKRGFCPVCGTHVAALDYGDDEFMGFNVPALDDPGDPALVPVNQSCRDSAVPWLSQVPDTQRASTG